MYNLHVAERIFDIRERTFKFGVRIVKLVANLPKNTVGFAISNQLIRSGTSVGANIEEAQNSSSKKEFIRSLTISLKEARETNYWLRIIEETKLANGEKLTELLEEVKEIIKILITIIKKSKLRN